MIHPDDSNDPADPDHAFKSFVRIHLDLEQGYDTAWDMRGTLHSFSPAFVGDVRRGFDDFLREGRGVDAYERLTSIEFPDAETLHAYLRTLYAYLFDGAGDRAPMPPG
ncbi:MULTISPECIES: hypothetical protein [unclassified Streptomyces]|uniref:hypothetical protein n=1 Tax=unclassified Streptomyces TaxID=2593676 RepID=UPI0029B4F97D|nr:hypothetical protein [Streptomyces sp. DK15]MDX2394555.1 hypothetical protein [Streptomyces sp. DK15]